MSNYFYKTYALNLVRVFVFCILTHKLIITQIKQANAQDVTSNEIVRNSLSDTNIAQVITTEYGKYGFIDSDFKTVIPAQFDEATDFRDGLALVKIDCKYGFIDRTGKRAIPYWFNSATPFIEGLALVSAGDKTGFINKKGETVILLKEEVEGAFPFYRGLAAIIINNKLGFIDKKGKIVIQPQFDNIEGFIDNFIVTKNKDKLVLINTRNKQISSVKFDSIKGIYDFKDYIYLNTNIGEATRNNRGESYQYEKFIRGLNDQWIIVENNGKQGFIDSSGNIILEPRFDSIMPYFKNLAGVKINNKWGFIDRDGNLVIAPQFNEITGYAGGMIVVKSNNKHGLIDPVNNIIATPTKFDDILQTEYEEYFDKLQERELDKVPHIFPYLSTKLIAVKVNDKYGFVNRQGKIIVKPKLEQVIILSENLFLVKINNEYRVIDNQVNISTTLTSNNISESFSGLAIALDKSGKIANSENIFRNNLLGEKSTILKIDLKFIQASKNAKLDYNSLIKLDNIVDIFIFDRGLAVFGFKDKYGYINTKGEIAINPKFEDVGTFFKELAPVSIKDNIWFIDRTGKVVIQPEFKVQEFGFARSNIIASNTDNTIFSVIDPNTKKFLTENQLGFVSFVSPEQLIAVLYGSFELHYHPEFKRIRSLALDRKLPISVTDLEGKIGFLNSTGEFEIPPQYDYGISQDHDCSHRWLGLSKDAESVILDCKNLTVFKNQFNAIHNFSEGVAKVRAGDKANISNTFKLEWDFDDICFTDKFN